MSDVRLARDESARAKLASKPMLEGEEAETALRDALRAIASMPGDVKARESAADLYARLGRVAEAIAQYRHLIGKYAAEGRLLRAITLCHRILQLDGSHAETQGTLADLFAERDTPRELVTMPSGMAGALDARVVDVESLARVPLFSDLDREAFLALLPTLRRVSVRAGETVIVEGDEGASMFVIARGTMRVVRRDGSAARVLDDMGEGEFFGEMALLSHGPRLASVMAVTDGELLELRREQLESLIARFPRVGEVLTHFYKERLLAHVLSASPLFRLLSPGMTSTLIDMFRIHTVGAGETLLVQGAPGRGLCVLLRGRCDVFHQRGDGGIDAYPAMREGDVFGELSLLHGGIVTANVRTASTCVILELQRQWFDELLLADPEVRARIYAIAGERFQRTQDFIAKEELEKRLV